ncbi:MAG: PAS domain-containing sensor histidine kinase, partial [Pseudomonadota bacterium]
MTVSRLYRRKRYRNAATLGLVVLGPVLALVTYLVLGPLDQGSSALALRLVLLADLVYVLVVAALVLSQIGRLIVARRAKSAGSRLHLRLTGVFALMALIPTVTVAVFAGLTVNIGLEGWFSDRVSRVVSASLAAAEAYESEQREDLITDARALARYIDTVRGQQTVGDREILSEGQVQVQRGLREAYM